MIKTENVTIYLTDHDHKRLSTLLDVLLSGNDPSARADLKRLNIELRDARIVPSEEIPKDVVTLNSQVVVEDLDDNEEQTWIITFPKDASVQQGRLSVLSPVGIALLGARAGQEIEWQAEGGSGRLKVKKILFQPEAAGRFDL